MKLTTEILLQKSKPQIDYNSNILLLGSCFSENIGEKIQYYKFKSLVNPFGILFHPLAIEGLIERAVNNKAFIENDMFYLNERWQCFQAHSKLSDSSKETLLNNLNSALQHTIKQLQRSTHIIITLGTAWVYHYIKSNHVVANCHKVPQKEFQKKLLTISEIEASLNRIIEHIQSVNPKATIIFTVSPVRHIKDGMVENQRSKAHLLSALHNHTERRLLSGVEVSRSGAEAYFPSYEIQMDELRDYRFYAEDLIHPNTTAINYIWEKFKQVWISEDISPVMNEVETIQKGLAHKPFDLNSDAHQKFLNRLRLNIERLQKNYPNITF